MTFVRAYLRFFASVKTSPLRNAFGRRKFLRPRYFVQAGIVNYSQKNKMFGGGGREKA
jgi:hypothetical protein